MRVAEVMTTARIAGGPEVTLRAAANRMWEEQAGSLVVLTEERLVGIVTERDVLRAAAAGTDFEKTAIGEVMTVDVVTVEPDTPLSEAARLMARNWIRHLPVVSPEGGVVGVLSQRDVVGVFAALWREPDVPAQLEADQLVSAMRLARISHGDLD